MITFNTVAMKLKFDLHVHTSASADGQSGIEEIINRAVKLGLKGVAITDHDEIGMVEEAERYVRRLGADGEDFLIIPGIEVSTRRGHLIVLGVRELIQPGMEIDETIRVAREMGGTIIAPHPFHPFRHGIGDISGMDVDAVETLNSRYITGFSNWRAGRMADRLGRPAVSGSDAHVVDTVGFGTTEVEVDGTLSVDGVLSAIRSGRVRAAVKMTPLRIYLRQMYRNAIRKLSRLKGN